MRTLAVHDYTVTGANMSTKWVNLMNNTVVDLFKNFNNFTYIGLAESGDRKEFVFQYKDYTNKYLRICNESASGADSKMVIRWSSTASLSTLNTFVFNDYVQTNSNVYLTNTGSNPSVCNFTWWYLVDENNNLMAFWAAKKLGDSLIDNSGQWFTTTVSNRDVVLRPGQQGGDIRCMYMDDDTSTQYFMNFIELIYNNNSSDNKIILTNSEFISSENNNWSRVSDAIINFDLRMFYNTTLNSYQVGSNHNYNSPDVRRIIQVGNDYYTQLINQFWCKDIDGTNIITEMSDATKNTQTT